MSKSRIEAFTDAVIAIIMTLLVLELHTPGDPTWGAFLDMSHKFIVYLVSFVNLAIYWNNHHHLFQLVEKIDGRVLWANNFFLFTLTLFPYITAWAGEYPFAWPPEALYGFIMLGANFSYYLLIQSLVKVNGEDSKIGQLFRSYPKLYLSSGLLIVAIIVGKLVAPIAVLIINALTLLMWFIPEKAVERIL